MSKKLLLTDIGEIMTLQGAAAQNGRGRITEAELSVQKNRCMLVENGKVAWVGDRKKLPRASVKGAKEISLNKANVFPGFIDCHTHSVFLGDRSNEFELRNQGVSYQEIAGRGGGILSTVRQTRHGSPAELQKIFAQRMKVFLEQGVTTVEVKSGYGLSAKDEIKILKAIKETKVDVNVVPTFLGAHALPPEFSSRQEYLAELTKLLPKIQSQGLASRVDIFIEQNYFSIAEARDYLAEAQKLGFAITIHADQLTRTGASRLAAEIGALSADHSICVSDKDITALAKSETTCVLLPTSDFYLRCPYPPARHMIDAGVRVALSTDFNPGTSPTQNIQFVGLLARQEMKMTLPEVFVSLTLGSAYALGFASRKGFLTVGADADFFVSHRNWREFFYDLNPVEMQSVWISGKQKV